MKISLYKFHNLQLLKNDSFFIYFDLELLIILFIVNLNCENT